MSHWKIKGLKGVGDVELELDDSKRVFVFFGSNGVGKTKTLEAIYHICLAQTKDFHPYLHNESNYVANTAHKIYINDLEVSLDCHHFYQILSQIKEKTYQATAFLGSGLRSSVSENYSFQRGGSSIHISSDTYFDSIEDAINDDNLVSFGMSQNVRQWIIHNTHLSNPYEENSKLHQDLIDCFLTCLYRMDNSFYKILKIDGNNVYLTIEGQERELSELSSGFISVVKIIQSIISAYSAFTNSQDLLNVKGVVLIDEIESHLHVEWQTKIIPTLKDLFPNTTFYIATHSPLVLSQLHEGEAYLLKRDDDGVVRSEVIDSPNKRILQSVLIDAFDIDLNQLKRDGMKDSDQTLAKKRLLELLGDE